MNVKYPLDPWGTPYIMTCGLTSIAVGSLGEDREIGTADDIWSDE